jgi:Fe-S cluster assembly ATP-binding protein
MPSVLEVRNLHVSVEDKPILKGLNLTVKQGETHALMGPNGTGKSTLAYTLMGHPSYVVTEGEVIFKGVNLLELKTDERSRLGLFLAFQYPVAIPGVSVANFLRTAINTRRRALNPADKGITIPEFRKLLRAKMEMLKMSPDFAGRYLNDGFSGGEKKRAEVLQMAALHP